MTLLLKKFSFKCFVIILRQSNDRQIYFGDLSKQRFVVTFVKLQTVVILAVKNSVMHACILRFKTVFLPTTFCALDLADLKNHCTEILLQK